MGSFIVSNTDLVSIADAIRTKSGRSSPLSFPNGFVSEIQGIGLSEKAPVIINEEHGPIASFYDGADNQPVEGLTIGIEPVQSGSGDPSPSNVRPISGRTGANVKRTGKNLLYWNALSYSSSHSVSYAISENGNKLTICGTADGASEGAYLSALSNNYDQMPFGPFPAGTYTVTAKGFVGANASDRIVLNARYADGTLIIGTRISGVAGVIADGSGDHKTFTATKPFKCAYFISIADGSSVDCTVTVQMERASTLGEYEPYYGAAIPISWQSTAGTIYGGTLDVTTGVLTVTHGNIASYAGESINEPWISSEDVYSAGETPTTGAQVVYPLTTPTVYQLTPQQLSTLLGDNSIWADTGDTSVQYRADTKLFIETHSYKPPAGGIPKTDLESDVQASLEKADTAIQTVDSALSDSSTNPVQNKVVRAALDSKADDIIETASGAIASFSDGSTLPVKDLTIAIEPVQSGSGDPSPDNVRTISGRTGANVWDDPVHGGSIVWNQYAKELKSTNWEPSNGTDTYTDGVARYEITTVGSTYYANKISTKYAFTGYELHKYYAAFTHRENKTGMLIGFTYVASNCGAIANSSTDWVRSEAIGQISAGQGGANKWLAVRYNSGTGAGAATREVGDWFEAKDMVFIDLTLMFGAGNEPSTVEEFKALFPKEYYAYNNGTTTCVSAVNGDPYWTQAISWQSEAGTVYAGTLDLTTGLLTVTKRIFDLGNVSWQWVSSISQFMSQQSFTHLVLPESNAVPLDAVCDCYAVRSYSAGSGTNNSIFIPGGSGQTKFLRIKDSRFSQDSTGAAALKTYLSGHYIVFKVDDPQTYQLTPQQLSTLLGDNSIWADTGDSTVQYRADTKLYIAAIKDENRQLRLTIAPIEDGDTASQAYAQGKYFFRNGSFCKAKTSIASGASFTLNTNYEVTTVAAELFAALNS